MTQTLTPSQRTAELHAIFAGRQVIVNLGQFSQAQERRLAWAVRRRLIRRERAMWPDPYLGTCTKSWYFLVGA